MAAGWQSPHDQRGRDSEELVDLLGAASDTSDVEDGLRRKVAVGLEVINIRLCRVRVLMSHRTRWETPRGMYDEHNSKFSLSMKPKFNRPVGERNHF
jgi:hypothetical protein